jgi:hypothetical protein
MPPRQRWTVEEDEKLKEAIALCGTRSWKKAAVKVPGRTGKQCRQRWLDKLAPEINRDGWTPEEDLILIRRHEEFGNAWSAIGAYLPRRACGAIKNRWNCLSRRDVPNHTREFEEMAESHAKKDGRRVGEQRQSEGLRAPERGDRLRLVEQRQSEMLGSAEMGDRMEMLLLVEQRQSEMLLSPEMRGWAGVKKWEELDVEEDKVWPEPEPEQEQEPGLAGWGESEFEPCGILD